MKISKSTLVKLLIGILISGFFIYYLKVKIDFSKVKEEMSNADWTFFYLAILCSFLSHVSRGLRWSILLRDQGYKTNKVGLISATFFGYFINIIIPRGGEIARCSSMEFKFGLPTDKLLGTIVLERVIDMLMLVLCALLVLTLDFNLFLGIFQNLNISGSYLIVLGIIGFVSLLSGVFILVKFRNKFKFLNKVYTFFSGVIDGVLSLRKLKRKGLFLFH